MAKRSSRAAQSSRRYWLFKSKPDCYSVDDLQRDRTTGWDGVRNYQARNFLRDDVQVGDGVLFYHSNADPPVIAGTAEVVHAATPDPTAFDPTDSYYDPKSRLESPTWFLVEVRFVAKFEQAVTRDALRECAQTAGMMVLQRGSRLSIQPVTPAEWEAVHRLAGVSKPAKKQAC